MSEPGVVGFVGAGAMGAPMISRLTAAGYIVRAYDTSSAALANVKDLARCQVASSAADAARSVEWLITMLPNGRAVRDAVLGDESGGASDPGTGAEASAVDGLAAGSVLIDMSSSGPWETIALAEALRPRGIRMVDAPVSGGVRGATAGTLAIVAGGSDTDVDRVRPLLEVLGAHIFHAGPLGAGHAVKALNNLLSAAGFAATIEALRVAQAYGIDPEVFTQIVDASSGGNNTTRNKLRQFVLSETFGSGFSIGLMAKDINTAMELARRHQVGVPLSENVAALWQAATAELGPAADHTEYARTLEEPPPPPPE